MKIHPVAQLFPMLSDSELHDLAQDIKTNGLQQPIVMQGDTLLDGRNRLAACEKAGVNPTFRQHDGDATRFIISANLRRRHLNESQRAMVAARLANMPLGGATYRSANSHTDVSLNDSAELLNVGRRTVADAKLIEREAPELAAQVMRGEKTVHAAKQEIRPHVAHNSGENEWYTPRDYIVAAREVMGSIDCDPASSPVANKLVEAKVFYTKESDGLTKKWPGNVWMNPPYAQPLISKFSEKITEQVQDGTTNQACVLVNNATETEWFQRMLSNAAAVCFLKGRVKFLDPSGNATGAPLQGQAILYFGERENTFCSVFTRHGTVLVHARQ